MEHGLDCFCDECKAIRKLIRDGVHSGKLYLSGLEEDKRKIMKDEK